jgi:hypothetical protein
MLCFNYISGRPRGICSDDQGFIYVATNSGQLLKFSPEGNIIISFPIVLTANGTKFSLISLMLVIVFKSINCK